MIARRARIGVVGTVFGDWDYNLIYEFGGTPDSAAALENAYITYKGIKNLYIDGGYMDVPYTLDEATSSNNSMFIERASSQVIATNIAAGDFRSAVGFHANGDWWWVGSYFTGPASTVSHTLRPQTGATARGVVVPVNNATGSLILGADAQFLFDTGGADGTNTLASFSDRIEVADRSRHQRAAQRQRVPDQRQGRAGLQRRSRRADRQLLRPGRIFRLPHQPRWSACRTSISMAAMRRRATCSPANPASTIR